MYNQKSLKNSDAKPGIIENSDVKPGIIEEL